MTGLCKLERTGQLPPAYCAHFPLQERILGCRLFRMEFFKTSGVIDGSGGQGGSLKPV